MTYLDRGDNILYYETNLTKLYNGDCVDVMKQINDKVSLVITSPPYNIIRPNSSDRGYDLYKDGMSNDEYSEWIVEIFNSYDSLLEKNGVVLFNMSYGAENTTVMNLTVAEVIKKTKFTLADIIIWKKQSATPNNVSKNRLTRIVEFIYVFVREKDLMTFETNKKVLSKRKTGQRIFENKFNFIKAKNNDTSTEINKATFSSQLVQSLLDLYYVGGTVFDNFSGTGTTPYTCCQNNIKSIAIELSEKQCQYTVERLKQTQIKFML